MSGDVGGGWPGPKEQPKRQRQLKRARVGWPPALRELKELLYEMYLAAGAPSLNEIAGDIAADDTLQGAPGRDTVHRYISDPGIPASQADVVTVASVLARRAAIDRAEMARRVRSLWTAARTAVAAGRPTGEFDDRLALRDLDVHPALDAGPGQRAGTLPPYVPRDFDLRLRRVVADATTGDGGVAVLVGDSFTGKTRTCWEAVRPLPAPWRLWCPMYPAGPEALLRGLDDVAPHTVLWLDDAQRFLAPEPLGEQAAAALRALLADADRGPLLVLATLWPEHWHALTEGIGHRARLLRGHRVDVPTAFTAAELSALAALSKEDRRLREAAEHARDGEVVAYLAGGPALLDSYLASRGTRRALVEAAMDAHRLSGRPHVPSAWLAEAVPAYLTRSASQRAHAEGDTYEAAVRFATLTRPPLLLPVPAPSGDGATSPDGGGTHEPSYRLADYLGQYGRRHREEAMPPAGFWAAAQRHAQLDALADLGDAAWDRGLHRDAARLYRRGVSAGDQWAASRLLERFPFPEAASYVAARVSLTHNDTATHRVTGLLRRLVELDAVDPFLQLVRRIADEDPLDRPFFTAVLLELISPGPFTPRLARRAALRAPLEDAHAVARLVVALHRVADDVHPLLADRIAARFTSADPHAVAEVAKALVESGAVERAAVLATRLVGRIRTDAATATLELLGVLRGAGLRTHADSLAENAAWRTPTYAGFEVAELLTGYVRAEELAADILLERIASEPWGDNDPYSIARVLRALCALPTADPDGAKNPAATADPTGSDTERSGSARGGPARTARSALTTAALHHVAVQARQTRLDNPHALAHLVTVLAEADRPELALSLVARTAKALTPGELGNADRLLRAAHLLGPSEHFAGLARRCAADSSLASPSSTARLLTALRDTDSPQRVALAARAARKSPLNRPEALLPLIEAMHKAGTGGQLNDLATRILNGHATEPEAGTGREPSTAVRIVNALLRYAPGPAAVALARKSAKELPDERVYDALSLLHGLDAAGLVKEADALARRFAARVPLTDGLQVARLLRALRRADRVDACATLLARDPEAGASLDDPMGIAQLLRMLSAFDADDRARTLAGRTAALVLTDTDAVAVLIETMSELGLRDSLPELAAHAAAEAPLGQWRETSNLFTALKKAGQHRSAERLVSRLPSVGFADAFFGYGDHAEVFAYGREPSGEPAAPWFWRDLE
ncbi:MULTISPECIES: hypothetical protein [Streptomyces]|uniref:ATP-binding protein n=1 Tax=Streptomyces galilaeus TaxID=33899 RepID=A0ABW9IYA2_STRGJ